MRLGGVDEKWLHHAGVYQECFHVILGINVSQLSSRSAAPTSLPSTFICPPHIIRYRHNESQRVAVVRHAFPFPRATPPGQALLWRAQKVLIRVELYQDLREVDVCFSFLPRGLKLIWAFSDTRYRVSKVKGLRCPTFVYTSSVLIPATTL